MRWSGAVAGWRCFDHTGSHSVPSELVHLNVVWTVWKYIQIPSCGGIARLAVLVLILSPNPLSSLDVKTRLANRWLEHETFP